MQSGGCSLPESGRGRRHSGVHLHLDSHLQHSIGVPESRGPSEMMALSPSIRPADRMNQPLLLGSLPARPPTAPQLVCILTQPRYPSVAPPHAAVNPLVQDLFSRNVPNVIKVRLCLAPPRPNLAPRPRGGNFGGKLVSWHVISRGEFLIRDLVETCQSPSCYRFSILSLAAPLRPSHPPPHPTCLPSGSALLTKRKKSSRCETPLLLHQLPRRCIILASLASLPRSVHSPPRRPHSPSPPPTQFLSLFFSSLPFIPAALLGSVAHQLQQH